MPTPTDNYRNGYEEGKNRTLGSVAAEVMFAQMLRDDPGGHFKRGYQDAINGRPFAPSLQPTRSTPSSGRSPNFIEALLIGYFMAVFWIIKELVKAPFQLIGSLSRGEKPAVWVIVRNVIIVGLTVALTWWAHHVNEMQASSTAPSAMPTIISERATSKPQSESGQNNWRQYHNGRFGFTVSYPPFLNAQGESANGDGQEFVSEDGSARLAVWGSSLTLSPDGKLDLAEEFRSAVADPRLSVTYKLLRKEFFVVSGYVGENILYRRETLKNNVFWGFRLTYDRNKRAQYDDLPATITRTLVIPETPN